MVIIKLYPIICPQRPYRSKKRTVMLSGHGLENKLKKNNLSVTITVTVKVRFKFLNYIHTNMDPKWSAFSIYFFYTIIFSLDISYKFCWTEGYFCCNVVEIYHEYYISELQLIKKWTIRYPGCNRKCENSIDVLHFIHDP